MGLRQVAIAADRLLNTLTGGYADEMLSARAWRLRTASRKWAVIRRSIDGVFFDATHCQEAFNSEMRRKYAPTEYRA